MDKWELAKQTASDAGPYADPKVPAKPAVKFRRTGKSRRKKLRPFPSIPERLKRDYLGKAKTYKLSTFNPFITCPVCQGYMVDATTITECLHSFCRSCILKHLEKSFHCPLCNEQIHKTNPWYNLRSDTALQDIIGKLIPNFIEGEERRRKVFYKSRGLPVPEKVTKPDLPPISEGNSLRESQAEASPSQPSTVYQEDDQITMQLEMKSMDQFTEDDILPLKRKFVRCSSLVTIGLLQKFLARKLKLEAANQIEILCSDMELGTDFTLHYIKDTIAAVQDQSTPLLLYYGLTHIE